MNVLEGWRLNDIEAKAREAYARTHAIDSMRDQIQRLAVERDALIKRVDELRQVVDNMLHRVEVLEQGPNP